jgi:pimeloyl-ACP methyl ester carboxylesterase
MSDLYVEEWGVGDPVLFVHGSFDPGVEQWIGQRPLSDRFRLVVIDRRGFGGSPAAEREDFGLDADDVEQIIEELGGVHLVGLSYGALSSLLVGARHGSLVKSLCLIEPPLYSILRGHPGIESMIKDWTGVLAADWDDDLRAGWVAFMRALGLSWTDFGADSWEEVEEQLTDRDLASAPPSLKMRPPWEAVVPLDALRDQPFPKLIVSGDWQNVSAQARELAGAALKAICDELAEQIGAKRVIIPDAAHTPQVEQPAAFNQVLSAFLLSD